MVLFHQRVSSFQVEGLQALVPVHDKDGKPMELPLLEADRITIKAGEVVLTVSLSKDKKLLEVDYAPKPGKAHDHQTRTSRNGAMLQVVL